MMIFSFFFCLLCATWTDGASFTVEGYERGKVSFQCSHRFAVQNHKYFCKDPCKDSRDILATVGPGRRVQLERITLVDFGDGIFNVTLSELRLSDSGRYWCGVNRLGADTFTEVHLTVKEAVANGVTTVIPKLSTTWTYQDISNSTQLTAKTSIFTASNHPTGGEPNISTGTVLYATIGTVITLTMLVLVTCFRKCTAKCCRKNSKPQPQVCFSSTGIVGADEQKVECVYDNIDEELLSIKLLPEKFLCSHHYQQDPTTSASTAAECRESLQIYENICTSESTADSGYSPENIQEAYDISSRIYINPLPYNPTMSESGDDSPEKYTNKPTETGNVTSKPEDRHPNNASSCSSSSDTKEARRRSLWFGLDLSGIV